MRNFLQRRRSGRRNHGRVWSTAIGPQVCKENMRFTNLLRSARAPQKEPVPFQEILPLKLKNAVSGKGEKTSDVGCLQEMSILFACFKQNEFNQQLCTQEIQTFEKCYKGFLDKKRIEKEQGMKGVLTPGVKNLTPRQINRVLRRFPNP